MKHLLHFVVAQQPQRCSIGMYEHDFIACCRSTKPCLHHSRQSYRNGHGNGARAWMDTGHPVEYKFAIYAVWVYADFISSHSALRELITLVMRDCRVCRSQDDRALVPWPELTHAHTSKYSVCVCVCLGLGHFGRVQLLSAKWNCANWRLDENFIWCGFLWLSRQRERERERVAECCESSTKWFRIICLSLTHSLCLSVRLP